MKDLQSNSFGKGLFLICMVHFLMALLFIFTFLTFEILLGFDFCAVFLALLLHIVDVRFLVLSPKIFKFDLLLSRLSLIYERTVLIGLSSYSPSYSIELKT